MLLKWLVTGLVLYFFYKYFFRPSLKQGFQPPKQDSDEQIADIEIRRSGNKSKEEPGEFIDYEEIE